MPSGLTPAFLPAVSAPFSPPLYTAFRITSLPSLSNLPRKSTTNQENESQLPYRHSSSALSSHTSDPNANTTSSVVSSRTASASQQSTVVSALQGAPLFWPLLLEGATSQKGLPEGGSAPSKKGLPKGQGHQGTRGRAQALWCALPHLQCACL